MLTKWFMLIRHKRNVLEKSMLAVVVQIVPRSNVECKPICDGNMIQRKPEGCRVGAMSAGIGIFTPQFAIPCMVSASHGFGWMSQCTPILFNSQSIAIRHQIMLTDWRNNSYFDYIWTSTRGLS
jgi:hypothetical protein